MRARQPRRRLWCHPPAPVRPGTALAPARCRRGGGLASVQPGQDGCAAGCPVPERGGRGLAPSVWPVWPEGAAGQGMLRAEPQCRGDLNFGSACFWGCPARRGRGAGAGGAPPPAALPPFLSRPPCRAGEGAGTSEGPRCSPRLLPVPRRDGPAPRGGGAAARQPRRGGRQVRSARLPRRGCAGPSAAGESAGAHPERGGERRAHLLRCPRSPGRSRVALAAQRAAFAGRLSELLRGRLKHRLPEK